MKILKKSFLCIVTAILIILAVTGCSNKKENSSKSNTSVQNIPSQYTEVYIDDNATEEEIEEFKNKLESLDEVISIEYTDKKQAYYRAAERLGASSMELAGYTLENHPFPRSFDLRVKTTIDLNKFSDYMEEFDIVISTSSDYISKQ